MYSRREFGKVTLSGLALSLMPVAARPAMALDVHGVKIGLITGSLNPLPENIGRDPIDVIIEQRKGLRIADVELPRTAIEVNPLLTLSCKV